MKEELKTVVLISNKLPKDELDNFWDNLFGFLPASMFLFTSIFSLLGKPTGKSLTFEQKINFFLFSLTLFLYSAWTKMRKRKLKSIQTNLTRQQNFSLIESIAKENFWSVKTNKIYYKEYLLPFIFGHIGHKLTVIISDDKILFNLRNIGTSRGRMPYLLGFDTIKEKTLRTKIKNYA